MKRFTILALLAVCGSFAPYAVAAGFTPPNAPPNVPPQSCEQLAQLALPGTKITSAQTVAAGTFTPPAGVPAWMAGDPSFFKTLPAFCRVTATAKPSSDSDIKIEVWMPSTGWNGKFRGQGNGGFAGQIDYRVLGFAVSLGYATAATDTGHAAEGTDAILGAGPSRKNCRLRVSRDS